MEFLEGTLADAMAFVPRAWLGVVAKLESRMEVSWLKVGLAAQWPTMEVVVRSRLSGQAAAMYFLEVYLEPAVVHVQVVTWAGNMETKLPVLLLALQELAAALAL